MKRVKKVKQVCVRQSLLLSALVLGGLSISHPALAVQSIVGSWYLNPSDTHVVTTFLADGTYFEASDFTGDPTHTGVEWGTFTWDAVTGKINAVSLGDTNGDWGIANDVDGPQYASVSGNTGTIWQPDCVSGCSPGSIERILHPAGSIVGTWLLPPENGAGTLSFFSDGSYIMGQGGVTDGGGYPGMERGTYSWNSVTGQLIATSILTDTNGDWGLSNPIGNMTATLTVDGNLLGGDDSGTFSLAPAPVPEPETYAMMLVGLGLVGFAARRKKPAGI